MNINKCKENKGFVETDAVIAIVILCIFLTIIAMGSINIYNTMVSAQKSSISTDYMVKILESAKALKYNDERLKQGTYETKIGEVKNVFGVQVDYNYKTKVVIEDYSKTPGNTGKQDLIKTIELTISYLDKNLEKNITIKTLKINR